MELFEPELPTTKVEVIETLKMGTVNKIFLDFEVPFLSPEISEVILLWDRIDEKSVPIAERWFRKIYSFSKVSETLLVRKTLVHVLNKILSLLKTWI